MKDEPVIFDTGEAKREAKMEERQLRPTAKIYQFPKGGRTALHGQERLVKSAAAILPAWHFRKVGCSDCWYHEEAVEEDARVVRWS
jgi:hypothetical protein